jgi:hypothetical protein
MDLTGIKAAVAEVNAETIPELQALATKTIAELVDGLHSVIERLDGAIITIKIELPPRVEPLP